MAILKQSTAYSRAILMVDSADHVTGKTGLTLTITASKAGGSFASISPTVTELATGWYKLALTTSHTDTLGDLALHITSTGADPTDICDQVTARILDDLAYPATSGRSMVVDASGLVDANTVKIGPTGSGTAQTARDIGTSVLLSSGTGTGQLSLSSGAVLLQATQTGVTIPTVTNLTNAPGAGDFTSTMKTSIGTAVAASAVASVTGNVGGNVTGSVGSVATGGITASSIAADAIGASELAADAVAEIAAAISIPSAATIADAVWDEATSGHATAGTYGAIVDETHTQAGQMQTAFEVNGDVYDLTTSAVRHVWDVATSGHTTSGTFGEQCKTDIDDILTDTGTTLDGRIPAALVSGRIDANVGAMATDVMTSTALAASAASEIATAVLTTAMTESYATDGATMTLAQACYMLLAVGAEFSISGTTLTCKKVDGSTTAMTFTLDDATNPTSRTRAS